MPSYSAVGPVQSRRELPKEQPWLPQTFHGASMQRDDVVALLQKCLNPDLLVLLDDGDFFVEHDPANCFETGGGWLQRRWPDDRSHQNAHQVLGTYWKDNSGAWCAAMGPPVAPMATENLPRYETRNLAIAHLWLNRHAASCPA